MELSGLGDEDEAEENLTEAVMKEENKLTKFLFFPQFIEIPKWTRVSQRLNPPGF